MATKNAKRDRGPVLVVRLDPDELLALETEAARRGDPWTVSSLIRNYVRAGLAKGVTK